MTFSAGTRLGPYEIPSCGDRGIAVVVLHGQVAHAPGSKCPVKRRAGREHARASALTARSARCRSASANGSADPTSAHRRLGQSQAPGLDNRLLIVTRTGATFRSECFERSD